MIWSTSNNTSPEHPETKYQHFKSEENEHSYWNCYHGQMYIHCNFNSLFKINSEAEVSY
jgi:hypothetical protein